MVEKRTFVFLILATIVWATLVSTFAGYYYIQYVNSNGQLNTAQNSLNKVASSYTEATDKYDLLLSEYSTVYGNYQYPGNSSYGALMPSLGNLIADFRGNYTDLFAQQDINRTYTQLLNDYDTLQQNGTVTKEDFANLLDEYYKMFNLSALREQAVSISEATTLSVNVTIDYGNQTVTWQNETMVPVGYTLFGLLQKIANVNYSYYAAFEPGHVQVNSINNNAAISKHYWIWYYWNDAEKQWVYGPVGCDAWLLKDGGIYKWSYEG